MGADLTTELAGVLGGAVVARGLPGAVAGVWVDDAAHVAAHGVASAETAAPLTADHLFQVGSVTKTLTAAVVALLVEEGDVTWDEPVARHLPELAAALAPGVDLEAITVEQLLSHQSGFDGDHLLTHPDSPDLAVLAGARHLFDPGHGYSYSNAAFSLAGALVEAVEGVPYATAVRRRLLGPLGMDAACFTADEAITRPVAVPHWVVGDQTFVLRGGGWQPGWELGALDRAAGGLVATVPDLLRWGRFQLDGTADDGTALLSAEALARLHTRVVEADEASAAGLDWEVSVHDGVTVVGHGGLTVGYATTFGVVPEHGVVVAVVNHATDGVVNRDVRRWALERTCGIVVRDPEPDPDAADAETVARIEGRYLHAFGVLTVTAGGAPGTVRITTEARPDVGWQPPPDPPTTFAFTGPCDAVSTDGPGVVRLLRVGEGWVQLGGRRAPRIDD